MTLDNLFASILNDPHSDQLRLDYANICDSTDPARAEFIRLQFEERDLLRAGGKWSTPGTKADVLVDKDGHRRTWSGAIATKVAGYSFGRGFVEYIKIDAQEFLRAGERLYELAPIRRLCLTNFAPVAQAIFASPLVDRVVSLTLEAQRLNDDIVSLLASSQHLEKLQCLGLARNNISTAGLESLMRTDRLPALCYVDLSGCPVYDTDLGEEYADELGHIIYVKEGLWPIEERLGRKTWLHTVKDRGLGYTYVTAY